MNEETIKKITEARGRIIVPFSDARTVGDRVIYEAGVWWGVLTPDGPVVDRVTLPIDTPGNAAAAFQQSLNTITAMLDSQFPVMAPKVTSPGRLAAEPEKPEKPPVASEAKPEKPTKSQRQSAPPTPPERDDSEVDELLALEDFVFTYGTKTFKDPTRLGDIAPKYLAWFALNEGFARDRYPELAQKTKRLWELRGGKVE